MVPLLLASRNRSRRTVALVARLVITSRMVPEYVLLIEEGETLKPAACELAAIGALQTNNQNAR